MTVFIQVRENPQNFAVLLVQLQPQLKEEDDLYIVDSTPNREGFRLSKLYGSTRSFIFIEVGDYDWDKALRFANQNMEENKQDGLLHLREDLIISNTFIANVRRVLALGYGGSPSIIRAPDSQFPNSFKWYNPPVKAVDENEDIELNCFVFPSGGSMKAGLFSEETVVLLPNKPK